MIYIPCTQHRQREGGGRIYYEKAGAGIINEKVVAGFTMKRRGPGFAMRWRGIYNEMAGFTMRRWELKLQYEGLGAGFTIRRPGGQI